MKFFNFDQFVNEAKNVKSVGLYNPKLDKAADIIASFINKKTKGGYRKFPFIVISTVDGETTEGVAFYSAKDDSMFRVVGPTGNAIGIVGALEYSNDHASGKVDFKLTSDNFPIIKLLHEFALLINDSAYVEAVAESMDVIEEKSSHSFTTKEKKEVEVLLSTGMPATKIAEKLGVPYRALVKLKRNLNSIEGKPAVETANEATVNDKVKFLEETMDDIYQISRRVGAGAFNSLFISGRAGTGKTYNVERALKDEGLIEEDDYVIVSGAASVIMMYKKFYQYRNGTLVFDDCDAVFRDENGRNLMKAALDTKAVRKISYLKKTKAVYDPKDVDPEEEFNLQEAGIVPNSFEFSGRVIFISNLPKDKADPDGAIRSRSILIDVNPDDATLMERMKKLLPHLEPTNMPLHEKEEIFDFMAQAKDVSMRTFVKAAGFKMAGLPNWKRMAERYL